MFHAVVVVATVILYARW